MSVIARFEATRTTASTSWLAALPWLGVIAGSLLFLWGSAHASVPHAHAGFFAWIQPATSAVVLVFLARLLRVDREQAIARTALVLVVVVSGLAAEMKWLRHPGEGVLVASSAGAWYVAAGLVLFALVLDHVAWRAVHRQQHEEERRRVAVHEAGHVLMCAQNAIARTSVRTRLWLGDRGFEGETAVGDVDDLAWRLHFHLAGCAAEQLLSGDDGVGSFDDFVQWLSLLPLPEPAQRQAEFERQLGEVSNFLEQHRPLLSELSDALLITPTMDARQLAPYLAQVAPWHPANDAPERLLITNEVFHAA